MDMGFKPCDLQRLMATCLQGRERLWSWVQHYEPEHIWVAPECRFWGNYSRYNMGLGTKSCARILEEREHDRVHLELCNQLYMYQVGEGKHFHLEQPQGSEMMGQEELVEARLGTLPATFDMCKMGRLHLPQETQYIRKRTTVYTTSRIVFNALQEQMCDKQHVHRHIRGKEQIHGAMVKHLDICSVVYSHVCASCCTDGGSESVWW